MRVLKFNTLLEEADLDPEKVFLLRHKDSRLSPGRIFRAWRYERKSFEIYQQVQKWRNRFFVGSALASFIIKRDEALFVGIYDVVRQSRDKGPYDDPLLGRMPPEDRAYHITEHSDCMQQYEGKLIIDWGSGRSFRQRAHRQNKDILHPASRLPVEDAAALAKADRIVTEKSGIDWTPSDEAEMRKSLSEAHVENQKLSTENAELRTRVDAMAMVDSGNPELVDSDPYLATLQSEVEALKAEIERLKTENAKLKAN